MASYSRSRAKRVILARSLVFTGPQNVSCSGAFFFGKQFVNTLKVNSFSAFLADFKEVSMASYLNDFRVGCYPHPDIYRGYQNLPACEAYFTNPKLVLSKIWIDYQGFRAFLSKKRLF